MTLIRPGTHRARGEDVMCWPPFCDSGIVVLVTRGDEELALLGLGHTLALLLARGFKGDRVFVCV